MQASEVDSRSRRKALEMARTVSREAPQSKLTIAKTPGFLDSLVTSVDHRDSLVVGSALGLLHELVDDQQALAVVWGAPELVDAFSRVHSKLLEMTGDDREAVLEEVEMAKVVAEYIL